MLAHLLFGPRRGSSRGILSDKEGRKRHVGVSSALGISESNLIIILHRSMVGSWLTLNPTLNTLPTSEDMGLWETLPSLAGMMSVIVHLA